MQRPNPSQANARGPQTAAQILMSRLRQAARHLRHLPGLEGLEGLWNVARRPYHRLLNAAGGVQIDVAGGVTIRIPAEFSGYDWEHYEPETVRLAADWARAHSGGLFLDIGCSIGIFSAVALFANPTIEVLAFDSDLASLVATRRFCRYAAHAPLTVQALVADRGGKHGLAEAVHETERAIAASGLTGDLGTTRYICIGGQEDGIPRHALDDLLADEPLDGRPVLLKCDVEGAELLVLQGARGLLACRQSALLMSIHPPVLADYGTSREGVAAFIRSFGYEIDVVAIDHEEHWWCQPQPD
jgi:FkbM family methyltransferase